MECPFCPTYRHIPGPAYTPEQLHKHLEYAHGVESGLQRQAKLYQKLADRAREFVAAARSVEGEEE